MMREIVLHGSLTQFGTRYRFDVVSVHEAVRALTAQIKGFYAAVRQGEFRVIAGDMLLDETELALDLGRTETIHIVPVPAGSKDRGIFKVVLGVALLGVGFAVGAAGGAAAGATFLGIKSGTWLMMGAGMMLNGIGQMLSPSPTAESNEKADERPSYVFNSPLNITEEGNCIPLAYGECFCSTLVISSGFDVSDAEKHRFILG